jgi:predicted AlkP superfamily pyrophosphatase or phosphodiesterase
MWFRKIMRSPGYELRREVRSILILFVASLMTIFGSSSSQAKIHSVEHVIVIGCDGLSPDGIRNASAPVMKRMMLNGSWTLKARAVMPTDSGPNWASMITGVGPEQHGILSNDWSTNRFEIEPTVRGASGMFPTVFGRLREFRPSSVIGCFYEWDEFDRLLEYGAVDVLKQCKNPTDTASRAIEFILSRKPEFTFIHFDNVDYAGHRYGHGTRAYYRAVDVVDQQIGQMLKVLQTSKIMERTIILVTSDHGGVGRRHGNSSKAELEIPWLIFGRDVKAGYEIRASVNTYDTALTIEYILGMPGNEATIGKAIKEVFKSDPQVTSERFDWADIQRN